MNKEIEQWNKFIVDQQFDYSTVLNLKPVLMVLKSKGFIERISEPPWWGPTQLGINAGLKTK